MTHSTAGEYFACSFCKRPACKERLYKCTLEDCDQHGEVYCKRCGTIAHQHIDDHKFDIDADHIKECRLDLIESKIEVKSLYIFFFGILLIHLTQQLHKIKGRKNSISKDNRNLCYSTK